MLNRKQTQELHQIAQGLGLEVVSISTSGSNHFAVRLRKDGVERTSFASLTSGDKRSLLNWRANIRRMFSHISA